MQVICPQCQHVLDYSTERPRFCSQCGQALSLILPTNEFEPPTVTVARVSGDSTDLEDEVAAPGRHHQEGDAVGGYRLVRRIGAGAMGSVFEAEQLISRQRVAIKLIAPEYAMSPAATERFRLEGQLASTITHPRCVFVLAADEEAGQPYIVMELVTGKTLAAIVSENGPLSVADAIRKILDVIDGLQEAHRLGVIHRDVKPSNCFLDDRGRVKVGDFGLAKSQQEEGDLTRTGTFVGTVLFASPEQIKRQKLDVQSDVYSVCATVYFLLTGKAPFSGGDVLSAATRIVTEDPPSMLTHRPELPPGLDRVVLRGLERDRDKRWPDLESLRQALVLFLPGQLSIGGLGSRFVAHICDAVVLQILLFPLRFILPARLQGSEIPKDIAAMVWMTGMLMVVRFVLWMVYYTGFEGYLGWSPGKRLMRLRVCRASGIEPPGLLRGMVRSVVSFQLINLGNWLAFAAAVASLGVFGNLPLNTPQAAAVGGMVALGQLLGYVVGISLMVVTMRMRNGYRGLHEIVSGTRVVEPAAGRQQSYLAGVAHHLELTRPAGIPEQLGRFRIDGALRWLHDERRLIGQDPTLGRKVWITMRARPATDMERRRRDVTRPGRLRCVASGCDGDWHWDAFLAPTGVPLPAVIAKLGRLEWAVAASILEQLTEELTAACADDTVPEALSVHQVWVDEHARMQLLRTPLSGTPITSAAPETRSIRLLHDVAGLMLEGRVPADPSQPIAAPVPRFVGECVNRLVPGPQAVTSPTQFRDLLRPVLDRPASVSRPRRFGHVAITGVLMLCSIGVLMLLVTMAPLVVDLGMVVGRRFMEAAFQFEARRDLAVSLLQPDAGLRLSGLAQYSEDLAILERHKEQTERENERREDRLAFVSADIRQQIRNAEQSMGMQPGTVQRFSGVRDSMRRQVQTPVHTGHFTEPVQWALSLGGIVVWIGWAFLTRGGLTFRLLRLELVRRDGRRAARWQCLWRAMLFWAPLMTFWSLSLWLDQTYWGRWDDREFRLANRWMPEAAWYLWWTGAGLLAVYFIMAIWRPSRSLHDRLAGTWIVPR